MNSDSPTLPQAGAPDANSGDRQVRRSAFRPDINGLRAFAILAVLAFHFRLPGVSGGFAGVDVFFVISGYLMTGIVVGRLERGTFSVIDFYVDRVRRIVPALLVFLLAVLAAGAFYLVPGEFAVLGKNVATSAAFASNLRFRTDYFGSNIDQEWLLHTWSLSLEWQFYMIFPVVMLLIWRWLGRRWLVPLLALGGLASLALSIWLTGWMPTAAFYLLPSRGWELIAGGLVYLAPPMPRRWSRAAQLAGLALLALMMFVVTEKGWPGVQALLPVTGTMLVIAAARTDSRVTGNRLCAWIGLNSYSIYLWHWPIALLMERAGAGQWYWLLAGLSASFLLGHLSYRFVEGLTRGKGKSAAAVPGGSRLWTGRADAIGLVLGMAVVAGLGVATVRSNGWLSRFAPTIAQIDRDAAEVAPFPRACFSVVGAVPQPCRIGDGPVGVHLIGDSHAAAVFAGLQVALPAEADRSIAFNAYAACMPVLDGVSTDPQNRCEQFNRRYLPPLMEPRAEPVVLVANWQAYLEGKSIVFGDRHAAFSAATLSRELNRTACALARGGPTYIMLPVPSYPYRVARELQQRLIADPAADDLGQSLEAHVRSKARAIAMIRSAAASCGVGLLDPATELCRGGRCLASSKGRPLYYDRGHLTVHGAKRLAPMFAPVVGGGAQQAKPAARP